jgi:glycolate oxidase
MEIVKELKKILGSENVFTDELILSLHSKNAIGKVGKAIALVVPENAKQISDILKICYKHDVKIFPQGASTELSGSSTPRNGIIMSFSKMNKIEEINITDGYTVVEPGVKLIDLNDALAEEGYMFPVDPASIKAATVGGAINTGAGGMKGAKYGTMKDWVLGLEIALPNEKGSIVKLGTRTLKSRQGYDLVRLIVGSEGTLGIVTKAILKIIPMPENIIFVSAFFKTPEAAMNAINDVKKMKLFPVITEFLDEDVVKMGKESMGIDVKGEGNMVIIGLESSIESSKRHLEVLIEIMKKAKATHVEFALSEKEAEEKGLLTLRRAFYPLAINLGSKEYGSSEKLMLIEDIAVPTSKLSEAIKAVKEVGKKYGFTVLIGGHVWDGNLHPTIWANLENAQKVESFHLEIMEEAIKLGGTISAEHGIGEMKRKGLELEMKSMGSEEALEIMRKIKSIFDPKNILNPGKVV